MSKPGAHAAAFSARFPASHRRDVWLGGAAESDDSYAGAGNLLLDVSLKTLTARPPASSLTLRGIFPTDIRPGALLANVGQVIEA